jgi:hypothetical protein
MAALLAPPGGALLRDASASPSGRYAPPHVAPSCELVFAAVVRGAHAMAGRAATAVRAFRHCHIRVYLDSDLV